MRAIGSLLLAVATLSAPLSAGLDPHLDPTLVPGGCRACHRGHGRSGSPMLGAPQRAVCLSCHGSASDVNAAVARGDLAPSAHPPLLDSALSEPYSHPVSAGAFSRLEPGAAVCSSCHSPHRRSVPPGETANQGRKRHSTRDSSRFEHELCESCHGAAGSTTQSLLDVSRQFDPSNRSFHPVHAAARETAPSVAAPLRGKEVNCTDCHGDAAQGRALGPHGSPIKYILRAPYQTADGGDPAASSSLCFRCHAPDAILSEKSPFPLHGEHVKDLRASCATCHNAHGSVKNRALIRFGEETVLAGVTPSASGKLAFDSSVSGSGSCYLTCHGKNHDPLGYGVARSRLPERLATRPPGARTIETAPTPRR